MHGHLAEDGNLVEFLPPGITNSNQNAPFGKSGPIGYTTVFTDSNELYEVQKLKVSH